jgi:hypothetical protein
LGGRAYLFLGRTAVYLNLAFVEHSFVVIEKPATENRAAALAGTWGLTTITHCILLQW